MEIPEKEVKHVWLECYKSVLPKCVDLRDDSTKAAALAGALAYNSVLEYNKYLEVMSKL